MSNEFTTANCVQQMRRERTMRRTQLMSYLLIVIADVVAMPEASVVLPSNGSRIGESEIRHNSRSSTGACTSLAKRVCTDRCEGRFAAHCLQKSAKTIEKGSRSGHPELDQSAVSLAMRFREFREDLQSRRMQHTSKSGSNSSCFAQPPTLVLKDFRPCALISPQARTSKLTLSLSSGITTCHTHVAAVPRLPRITGSQMSHGVIIRVPGGEKVP